MDPDLRKMQAHAADWKNKADLPSLLGNVHLIFEVAAVRCLGVLNLPAQVLYLRLQLRLLVLELEKRIEQINVS